LPDRVMVFVDYQNVHGWARRQFHPVNTDPAAGHVDPLRLGQLLVTRRRRASELVGVRVYRGRPNPDRQARSAAANDRRTVEWERSGRQGGGHLAGQRAGQQPCLGLPLRVSGCGCGVLDRLGGIRDLKRLPAGDRAQAGCRKPRRLGAARGSSPEAPTLGTVAAGIDRVSRGLRSSGCAAWTPAGRWPGRR